MTKKRPCALAELAAGCRARVARVEGTGDIRARLAAMGFTPDTDIEVLDCVCGRQLVKVRGCNMVLDGDTACLVTCARQEDEAESKKSLGFWRRGGKRGHRG